MSKYYDLVNRNAAARREPLPSPRREARPENARPGRTACARHRGGDRRARVREFLFPEPLPLDLPAALARQDAIRQLSERMAPTAAVEKSCRVAISGCRPRDGASSIAAALALDLSQRLSMRTILVDANLQSPSLHGVISQANGPSPRSPWTVRCNFARPDCRG